MSKAKALIEAAQALSMEVTALKFGKPTAYVYNPL
ncbi:MAG: single-stranded DNA-binding protein, partial [Opitutae bacterium]|nr:single-stranded DNA-binding protein [Opitutae bacterium]